MVLGVGSDVLMGVLLFLSSSNSSSDVSSSEYL
jgi:hypothetical protein